MSARDYTEESVIIASECPGLGNPWDMTPAQWTQVLIRISERVQMSSGDSAKFHKAHMRRLKREKQWAKRSTRQT